MVILITRFLGAREFGVFAIIFSYYGIFKTVSIFGIDYFLVREISKDAQKAGYYLKNSFILGIIFSAASICFMNFFLYVNNYSFLVRAAGLALSLALLPDSFIAYTEAVFIAFRRNNYILFVVCLRGILYVIFTAIVIYVYGSIFFVIIGRFIIVLIGLLINLRITDKLLFRISLPLNADVFFSIFKISFVIALIGIVNNIFMATDVIVLSRIKEEADVGLYSAAYKFINIIAFFLDSVAITLLPVLSRMRKKYFNGIRGIVKTFFRYFMPSSILIAILVCFSSRRLILLIFGEQFIDSSLILNILIWAVFFRGSSLVLGKALFAVNMQNYDFFAHMAACIVNLFLSIYFTLQWGYIGTAVATFVSYGVLFFIQYSIFNWFCRADAQADSTNCLKE